MEAFVKKGKIADRGRRKARAQKRHNVLSNFTHQRREKQKTKTKNLRSQDNSAWRAVSQKDGEKCFLEKKIALRATAYKEGTL